LSCQKKILVVTCLENALPVGENTWTPLTAASPAAVLENQGCRVKIFDRLAEHRMGERPLKRVDAKMLDAVQAFGPDVILMDTAPRLIWDAARSYSLLRKVHDGAIGLMGAFASALPRACLEHLPGLDFVVAGEAESAMPAIAAGDFDQAPNLWQRGESGPIPPDSKPDPVNPDDLPFPAFHLLDMDYYTQRGLFTLWGHHVCSLTLMTSRGCPGSCTYCLEGRMLGRKVRYRNLDLVMQDIERAADEYPIDAVYFRDCNFLGDRRRSEEFGRRMLESELAKRLVWSCQTRVDTVDPELLKLMRRAGCVLMEFGVETPLSANLAGLGKKVEPNAAERAFKLCRQAGIKAHAYLLTGYPGETLRDFQMSLKWVKKNRASFFFWNQVLVYPGTPLYAKLGYDFFEKADWTDRKMVENYFRRTFGQADPVEHRDIMRNAALPAIYRQRRRLILGANGPLRLLDLVGRKVKRMLFPPADYKGDDADA
jgi:anaerobic magnesium-protoporphyrin IX monomethyl ester cyclase